MDIGNPRMTNAPAENHAIRCGSVLFDIFCTRGMVEICEIRRIHIE